MLWRNTDVLTFCNNAIISLSTLTSFMFWTSDLRPNSNCFFYGHLTFHSPFCFIPDFWDLILQQDFNSEPLSIMFPNWNKTFLTWQWYPKGLMNKAHLVIILSFNGTEQPWAEPFPGGDTDNQRHPEMCAGKSVLNNNYSMLKKTVISLPAVLY